MKVSGIFLSILILSGFCGPRCAATVYHSNGSAANVQQIHNTQAVDGDTITIPAGTFSWTGTLRLTKAIILKGQTIRNDDGTSIDNTIIQDNKPDNGASIRLWGNGGQRLTGITFVGLRNTQHDQGFVDVHGTTPTRIDHCVFDQLHNGPVIAWNDYNYGVIDHVTLRNPPATGGMGITHEYMGATSGDNGDRSFTEPNGFGGPNFLFIEDSDLAGGMDESCGSKVVVRHCVFRSANMANHGTGMSNGNWRGSRAIEIYNCTWNLPPNYDSLTATNGGPVLIHDNVIRRYAGDGPVTGLSIQYYRQFTNFGPPFYQADGNNAWDQNDPQTHTLLRGLDQPGLGQQVGTMDRANPRWMQQATEPCYSWNNRDQNNNLVNFATGAGGATIIQGRDYFNNTPMPGYTPYVYPHPLTVGGNPSPPPPPTPTATPGERAAEMDFNNDGYPDYLLYNPSTRQTVIWYINRFVLIGHAYGPTLWPGFSLVGVADFNGDGKPDYLLYNPSTRQTVIWYLNRFVLIGHAYGPTPWQGWSLVAP